MHVVETLKRVKSQRIFISQKMSESLSKIDQLRSVHGIELNKDEPQPYAHDTARKFNQGSWRFVCKRADML
jgi:hypothetical protein